MRIGGSTWIQHFRRLSRTPSPDCPGIAGEGALQIRNPKKQASERCRSWRKSRLSKRPGSNSRTSLTASLRDRPLADNPNIAPNLNAYEIRFIQRGRPKAGAKLAMTFP